MNLIKSWRQQAVIGLATALMGGPALALAPNPGTGSFAATTATVGRLPNNEFVTPVNQRLSPAGKLVELAGLRPQAVAISPDNRIVVTSGKNHAVIVLDAASGKILQTVPLPEDIMDSRSPKEVSEQILDADSRGQLSFTGLTFSPDGSRLYMANVNGDIKVFAVENGQVKGLYAFALPEAHAPERDAEIPAGIAVSPDGKRLYVALNLSNRLIEMDAATGRKLRLFDVGVEPYDVVLAKDKVYVSNWGGRRPGSGDLTDSAGGGMVVRVDPVRHIASEGSVTVVPLGSNTPPKEILTGLHACAMALSPDGRRLVAANAGSDTLSVIDTETDQIVETIWARQQPGDLFGAQPNALAFDKSGKTLFVCNGTQNAVAVIQFRPGESKLAGLIPAGWFPGAIVYDRTHQSICVANIKGFSPGVVNKKTGRTEYNSKEWYGSLSFVPVPSPAQLAGMTRTALANLRYPLLAQAALPARPGQPARPVPQRAGEPSTIKHVIYIIKENRTYDQVLGDVGEGNGDPSLCIFGRNITPNEHNWVSQFILLDNTYCCGSQSCDGHQWTDTAMSTDYMEKSYAGFPRSYPAGGGTDNGDAMAFSPAGFIWDNALTHGRSIRDFGEFTSSRREWTDRKHRGRPGYLDIYHDLIHGTQNVKVWSEPGAGSIDPFVITSTVGFDLNVPDQFRATQFLKDLKKSEQAGRFPDLTIMWLSNDHTCGAKPGDPTPAAYLADNDLAMGRILEGVSHSIFWKDTCIFVIEDDPQAGWDHVSGYRTTAYVASPYSKRRQTVHTQYNQTSLVRTIELILGLPPMNQMDATATPMFDCFVDQPDLTPFDAVPNKVPLDQMNSEWKKISDRMLRKDARVSARLPFDREDQCPDDVLNRILWRSAKGSQVPYPDWAVQTGDKD
jgi:YVTN family beta-propeller protein